MKQQYPQFEDVVPPPHGICEACAEHEQLVNLDTDTTAIYCEHHQAGAVQAEIEGDMMWTVLTLISQFNFERFAEALLATKVIQKMDANNLMKN